MAGFKSIMTPQNSVVAGLATVGLVYGLYHLQLGDVSQASASSANHPLLEGSRKKAGYSSVVLVAGVSLLARDPNIAILGSATIIAMELSYRHAIMQDPQTGRVVSPAKDPYQPAGNVVPFAQQGATG